MECLAFLEMVISFRAWNFVAWALVKQMLECRVAELQDESSLELVRE